MSKPLRLTPLKIYLSDGSKGTARVDGEEIIPYTPYAARKLSGQHVNIDVPKIQKIDPVFLTQLRPYQQHDIQTLVPRRSSANFSEPRTGKTPTAIRLFKAKGLKKILIVTTAASLFQWKGEFSTWFKASAEVITSELSLKRKQQILSDWGTVHNAIIISYDSIKLITRKGKVTGFLNEILKHKDIDGLIVDEAHQMRNPKSLRAQSLFKLSFIPHKHAMTGTPAHGKLQDIYSILHLLYPQLFTGYWRFIEYYFRTESVEYGWGPNARQVQEIGNLQNKYELPQFINRIAVQHKRKDPEVMPWLPDKDYMIIKLTPTEEQLRYIKDLEEMFETEHIIVENVLTQLIRIRQICNAPELLDLGGGSPKVSWLSVYLEDYADTPVIIFSSFTKFIKILQRELNTENVIIGETAPKRREKLRKDFQDGKINHLIINTQAGKEALTLDRAQVAIFLDIYPPYGDVDQAENRFTSTTEALKDKPHTIIQVMMDGTYDEKLFNLVKARASETEILNNYKAHLERKKSK